MRYKTTSPLEGRGAQVRKVRLPPGPDGEKVGLDDYLVAHDPQAFHALFDSAHPATELNIQQSNAIVEPYPLNALCGPFKRLVLEGAAAKQCPPDFIAVPWVRDEASIPVDALEVAYTHEELKWLVGKSPDELRAIHAAKRELDGALVGFTGAGG